MELYVTRHARNRKRLYGIVAEEGQTALTHPDHVTAGSFGRQHAWKPHAQGGWLRVTFKDEGTRRSIITVTPKQQFPGAGHAH